jgi:hypothetical protein
MYLMFICRFSPKFAMIVGHIFIITHNKRATTTWELLSISAAGVGSGAEKEVRHNCGWGQ